MVFCRPADDLISYEIDELKDLLTASKLLKKLYSSMPKDKERRRLLDGIGTSPYSFGKTAVVSMDILRGQERRRKQNQESYKPKFFKGRVKF
uniref:Uncharacterized protein n=1 Tax=Syphacia muris TaxID=451379 RepID=A0A0N5AQR4_9BILA